ncbi:hypothetical protein SLA2020_231540 [Shorea laevis]
MAANGSAQPTFKNAIGAMKDSTKVGLVKVNLITRSWILQLPKPQSTMKNFQRRNMLRLSSMQFHRPSKTQNWTVALKTLIVIHRALREVNRTFLDELINFSRHRSFSMLNLAHLRDDSSTNAWDYSAWREQLRNKHLDTQDLLEQLPVLQQLFPCLLACKPEGAAVYNNFIHYALSMVTNGESVNLYVAITDRIVRLVDKLTAITM